MLWHETVGSLEALQFSMVSSPPMSLVKEYERVLAPGRKRIALEMNLAAFASLNTGVGAVASFAQGHRCEFTLKHVFAQRREILTGF